MADVRKKLIAHKKLMVRTSERRDFARCPQRHWWGYVECLKPNNNAPALAFGDLIHQALAIYYPPGKKRGPHPAEAFVEIWEKYGESIYGVYDDEGTFQNAFDLGCEMLLNYVKEYEDSDKAFEIIAPEQTFQIDVYDEQGNYLFTYVGTADALVRNIRTKKIGLFEHKTTAGLPPRQWLAMDEQAGSYWTFTPDWLRKQGVLTKKQDLDFILYNFLRKGMEDTRKKNAAGQRLNKNGSVSKRQPNPLFYRELVYRTEHARQALRERAVGQVQLMSMVRSGALPILKNPTDDCKFCPYKDMCELHEAGADWEQYRDAMFHTWNPYEAHLDIPTEETR